MERGSILSAFSAFFITCRTRRRHIRFFSVKTFIHFCFWLRDDDMMLIWTKVLLQHKYMQKQNSRYQFDMGQFLHHKNAATVFLRFFCVTATTVASVYLLVAMSSKSHKWQRGWLSKWKAYCVTRGAEKIQKFFSYVFDTCDTILTQKEITAFWQLSEP